MDEQVDLPMGIVNLVKHWVIMQFIYAQSAVGEKTREVPFGLWLGVLAVIFSLLVALMIVNETTFTPRYAPTTTGR